MSSASARRALVPSPADRAAMARALALAARGEGRTAPNPMVGAVVRRDGRLVGEGWHPRAGEPHAEIFALREAGDLARGADLFVTLEPCAHHGKTPPCAEAIAAAGIARVFAAMEDPFPEVAGRGFAILEAAGIAVHTGLLETEARELNRAYLKVQSTGLPWVTLKLAATLDGRIATRSGESRWITGPEAREHVHRLRDRHDAVLVGAATVAADDPELTARIPGGRDPARVVVAGRTRLPASGKLAMSAATIPTYLAGTESHHDPALEAAGARFLPLPPPGPAGLDLELLLRALPPLSIHSVLCEGGGRLAGSLLQAGLVDEVVWFAAPVLAGDAEARPALSGGVLERLADAWRLERVEWTPVGRDLMVRGRPVRLE